MRLCKVLVSCLAMLSLLAIPASAQISWQKYSGNPVVVGTCAQINAPCVIFDDSDGLYKMWFNCGTGYTDWRIHYATSPDGLTWTGHGPVLSAVSYSPCVLKVGSVFHMWYCRVDTDLGLGYFTHATSVDGTTWTNAGRKYYYSGPSVLYEGGSYKGWFSQAGKVYYSTSADGMTWGSFTKVLSAPPGWVEVNDPCVLHADTGYEMWFTLKPSPYTGLYVGYATSANGTTWTAWTDPVLSPGPGTWDSKCVLMPAVLKQGTAYKMWYPGSDETSGNGRAIGFAGEVPTVVLVSATIDFDPNTLNLKSNGRWVTCYIELAEGYDVADIDVSTVMLNGSVPAAAWPWIIGDYDLDGIADLMVKFDRSDVGAVLSPGRDVEVVATGSVGSEQFSGTDSIDVIDPPGSRHGNGGGGTQGDEIPVRLHPNPFNPSVRIEYEVAEPGIVLVQILTVGGQVVRTIEYAERPAGTFAVEWNGKDSGGRDVSSGLYICRVEAGSKVVAKKLTLLK